MVDKLKELAGNPGGEGGPMKGLEGSPDDEGKSLAPREFFWDSIVLYVVSSIIALASVETITEFIRGSQVNCLIVNETENEVQSDYVNNFCSSSLPLGQYFPVFIVVHAILMGVPHYLWLNHYGANFDYFFQLASTLDRLREESSGDYSKKNALIFEQLEMAFIEGNCIFRNYVVKLFMQWLFSVIGLAAIVFCFTDFSVAFACPRSLAETFDPFWPVPEKQAICVFTSLYLISLVRSADIILVSLVVLGLTWSLIWCFIPHPAALGSEAIAKFSFYSSLRPEQYHRHCSMYFTFYPRIRTDLDFMMMRLFRTDGGLGLVMKSVQISKKIRELNDAESRRLNFLRREAAEEQEPTEQETPASVILDLSTKGKVQSKMPQDGTDRDEAGQAGTQGALCITFGSPSFNFPYALQSLGRFRRVGFINFSPFYSNPDCLVKMEANDLLQVVTVVTSDDILATNYGGFLNDILDIWKPGYQERQEQERQEQERQERERQEQEEDEQEEDEMEKDETEEDDIEEELTDYIVVGPVSNDIHKNTVNLLLDLVLSGYATDSATLLTVHPLINGTSAGFKEYTPKSKRFVPVLSQTTNVHVSGPPSEDEQVPEMHCQFKFTLYMQKNKDRSEGVDMGDTSEANESVNAQQRKQEQLVTIFERF